MVTDFLASKLSSHAYYASFAALGVGALGLWIWSGYTNRGEWYAQYASATPILVATGVATLASFLAVGYLMDRQRRKRPLTWMLPSAVLLGSFLYIGTRWIWPWPTLDGAQAAFEAGDLERATAELDALVVGNSSSPEVDDLRAEIQRSATALGEQRDREAIERAEDLRIDQVGDLRLKPATALIVHRTWTDPDKREIARKRLLERARATSDEHWKRSDGPALTLVAQDTAGLDEHFTRQTKRRAALASAQTCLDQRRLDCARAALAEFDTREPRDPSLDVIRDEIEAKLGAADGSSQQASSSSETPSRSIVR